MQRSVCLVTGASSGLGKATALELARQGAGVILVCRDAARGEATRQEISDLAGSQRIELMLADLSSQQDIRQLAQEVRAAHSRLDVLVNNVGAVFMTRRESVDGLEMSLALNHLASFLLTHLLLDTLKDSAPARIVNVTTRLFKRNAIHLDDLQFQARPYSGFQAYRETKLANILFTFALARRLADSGVTANCVHPGIFKSNFGSQGMSAPMRILTALTRPLMPSAQRAARRVVYVATAPELAGVSGKYFGDRKEMAAPPQAYDHTAQERLWALSEALTGITPPSTVT